MDEYYRTNDLGLAAYITCQGISIKDVDTTNTSRFQFVFNLGIQDGMRAEDQWWAGTLRVDPRLYMQAVEQMKDLIHHTKKRVQDARSQNLVY